MSKSSVIPVIIVLFILGGLFFLIGFFVSVKISDTYIARPLNTTASAAPTHQPGKAKLQDNVNMKYDDTLPSRFQTITPPKRVPNRTRKLIPIKPPGSSTHIPYAQ